MPKSPILLAATLTLLVVAPATLAAETAAPTTTLTLQLEGLASPTGAVMVALYNGEATWSGKPVRVAMVPVTGETASQTIEGLPPGTYAIKSFHDVNGNGKMDANPFGIPLEPFAFSNNAKGAMGQPGWAAAAFTVSGPTATHTLSFR